MRLCLQLLMRCCAAGRHGPVSISSASGGEGTVPVAARRVLYPNLHLVTLTPISPPAQRIARVRDECHQGADRSSNDSIWDPLPAARRICFTGGVCAHSHHGAARSAVLLSRCEQYQHSAGA